MATGEIYMGLELALDIGLGIGTRTRTPLHQRLVASR